MNDEIMRFIDEVRALKVEIAQLHKANLIIIQERDMLKAQMISDNNRWAALQEKYGNHNVGRWALLSDIMEALE